MRHFVSNYINDLHRLFSKTKATDIKGSRLNLTDGLKKVAEVSIEADRLGKKLIFIGNGGSAAIASHKALDYWFTGKIRGVSFSDNVNLTCVSNDFGYQNIFTKQIEMFADKGDILFAISSSGVSENIILAVVAARQRGCKIVTFSGFKEKNRLQGLGDLNFYVPSSHFNKVESIHLLFFDCILEIILTKRKKRDKENILVALDRDGTLIYDSQGYFGKSRNWREKVKFYQGTAEGIKNLNDFARVIVTSNQIGVAKGLYGQKRVKEINQYLDKLLREQGAVIDGWYFSPYVEKSWAKVSGLAADNPWVQDGFPETRKPKIGMIKKAAADLGKKSTSFKKIFVVGDSLDDLNMALNAGGIGVFFENGKNNHLLKKVKILEAANPGKIFLANNLVLAVKIIKRSF